MKYLFAAITLSLLLVSFGSAQLSEIKIIPKPEHINSTHEGPFLLDRQVEIVSANKVIADVLNHHLISSVGFSLKVRSKETRNKRRIAFNAIDPKGAGKGAYSLNVFEDRIDIKADSAAGHFYAIQSLLQLLSNKGGQWVVASARIADQPRFLYRGMHLDVARHFQPTEFVKKFIDQMARYKFNHFHWHLTDDQGWRIEIKKYPKLTEIGSKRPETVKERNITPYVGDGVAHGGFYTQEEIKDVVAYA